MEPVKILLGLGIIFLLFCSGCVNDGQPGTPGTPLPAATATTTGIPASPVPTLQTLTIPSPASPVATIADTRLQNALRLKSAYMFGNGTKWASDASVTRIWINDTYRWYNPEELQYDIRVAPDGKKYLFIFLSMVNRGTERAPLPSRGNIYVISDNTVISPYALHPLPMENPDSIPRIARIAEIEYSRKVYSSEMVEDYGYSHGQKLAYIAPGESNAVEGYIIYEVPEPMTPEKAYVTIVLPDKNEATWVLG
jgi:hypothetical protein